MDDKRLLFLLTGMLTRHEASRPKPYLDTAKPPKITIGIGRNLTDRGLSQDEIMYLFANDVNIAERDAKNLLGEDVYAALTLNRRAAIVDMSFNLGGLRLSLFKETLRAIKEARYTDAANGMRNSLWAGQVGGRATELADMMEKG